MVGGRQAADGEKRLVQAAATTLPPSACSSSAVFSSTSNGGGDVGGRWRREINVSNHLEVRLKGSPIPNSRILQTTDANFKFHPVLNLKSTSETGDLSSEAKFRFLRNTNSDDDCGMMLRNDSGPPFWSPE